MVNRKKQVKKEDVKLTSNYPIGDFLIRIKNAALVNKKDVEMRRTNLVEAVAKKLKNAGFLNEVKIKGDKLTISLRYVSKRPVLIDLKLVSKPGLRIYMSADDLEGVRSPSTFIISTPKGIMTTKEAIKQRVGGEVIVEIW